MGAEDWEGFSQVLGSLSGTTQTGISTASVHDRPITEIPCRTSLNLCCCLKYVHFQIRCRFVNLKYVDL